MIYNRLELGKWEPPEEARLYELLRGFIDPQTEVPLAQLNANLALFGSVSKWANDKCSEGFIPCDSSACEKMYLFCLHCHSVKRLPTDTEVRENFENDGETLEFLDAIMAKKFKVGDDYVDVVKAAAREAQAIELEEICSQLSLLDCSTDVEDAHSLICQYVEKWDEFNLPEMREYINQYYRHLATWK